MSIDYTYVRSLKASILESLHNEKISLKENLEVKVFYDSVLLPAKKSGERPFGWGGVVTKEGCYVETSGIEDRFGGFYETQVSEIRNEKVVYCGYLINHWGHFLIEAVARLWYFFQDDQEIDKYVFLGELNGNTSISGNYKEFFDLLGISDKLEVINYPVQYREVVVPELSYKRTKYYSNEYKAIFDEVRNNALLRSSNVSDGEKVFLSRRWFAEKTEVGVDMLDDFFERNGFYVLYPEKVSLTEMIHYLCKARLCAAESGTLPHNLLFSQDEKETVIIERQATPNEVQIDVDKIKALSVTYIDAYYTVYPVGAGYGPYFLAFEENMKRFVEDHKMVEPAKKYLNNKYLKKCFAKYMKIYRNNYGYQWGFETWQLTYMNLYYESYIATYEKLGMYLSQKKMFKVSQCFRIHNIKMSIRNILRK